MRALFGQGPEWSAWPLVWAGPVLAATGALLYFVSVSGAVRAAGYWAEGWKSWLALFLVRAAGLAVVAWVVNDPVVTGLAVLYVLSAPAFYPPQLQVLYGYRDPVVAFASQAGWLLAPVGLAAAWWVAR